MVTQKPQKPQKRLAVGELGCLLVFSFCLLAFPARGQHAIPGHWAGDSIAFSKARWECDTLVGVRFMHTHFTGREVFKSNQYFTVVEIPRGARHRLCFVADPVRATVSAFAEQRNALAAVNGSYFDMRTGSPICYLRIGGRQLGINTPGRHDTVNRKYYQNATIRLLPSGKPRFLIPDSLRMAESLLPDSNIMTAGPMLLLRGATVPQHTEKRFVSGRHNRTAIGLKPDGTVVLLVADGRCKGFAEGLTLTELTLVMRWLGCCDAVNLDGGGSSTMYVRGKGEGGIVNHPSDNGRFDAQGQRPVANAILVL